MIINLITSALPPRPTVIFCAKTWIDLDRPPLHALQPPHPAAAMPPEQLAEKVMMLQRLQMRRQVLADELARMDAGLRRELRTLPPSDFIPPDTLDPKSAYALRALQVSAFFHSCIHFPMRNHPHEERVCWHAYIACK